MINKIYARVTTKVLTKLAKTRADRANIDSFIFEMNIIITLII